MNGQRTERAKSSKPWEFVRAQRLVHEKMNHVIHPQAYIMARQALRDS